MIIDLEVNRHRFDVNLWY